MGIRSYRAAYPGAILGRFPLLDIKAVNDNDGIENQHETRLDWPHFCNRACRRILHSGDWLCPSPFRVISTRGERQATVAPPYPSLVQCHPACDRPRWASTAKVVGGGARRRRASGGHLKHA